MNQKECRLAELRMKEVINAHTGERYGYVNDALIDLENGKVNAILLPGKEKLMGLFGRREERMITWEGILQIGEDIILADRPPIIGRQYTEKELANKNTL